MEFVVHVYYTHALVVNLSRVTEIVLDNEEAERFYIN